MSEAKTDYWAISDDDQPPKKGWRDNKGKNHKDLTVILKLTTLASTLKETEEDKGSVTLDGGAVCVDPIRHKWIMIDGDDPKIGDSKADCEGGWDEDGKGQGFNGTVALVIAGGESRTRGVYELKRRGGRHPFFRRVDGWCYIRFVFGVQDSSVGQIDQIEQKGYLKKILATKTITNIWVKSRKGYPYSLNIE